MALIGLIVYNIQDYSNSGGYISTSKDNLASTVSSLEDTYESKKIDIFTDVVSLYPSKLFSKLGILAPPGTRLILNTNKTILIGLNGIYELDDNIVITSLKFIKPKNYVLDTAATETATAAGIDGMQAAEQERDRELVELEGRKDELSVVDYWYEYTQILDRYDEDYLLAVGQFNSGLNGIYKLDEDNPELDLYNIIIDFLY